MYYKPKILGKIWWGKIMVWGNFWGNFLISKMQVALIIHKCHFAFYL